MWKKGNKVKANLVHLLALLLHMYAIHELTNIKYLEWELKVNSKHCCKCSGRIHPFKYFDMTISWGRCFTFKRRSNYHTLQTFTLCGRCLNFQKQYFLSSTYSFAFFKAEIWGIVIHVRYSLGLGFILPQFWKSIRTHTNNYHVLLFFNRDMNKVRIFLFGLFLSFVA